jgi:hypothetical protein
LNKLEVGQLTVATIHQGLSVLNDFLSCFLPEDRDLYLVSLDSLMEGIRPMILLMPIFYSGFFKQERK